jgi:hypothetical protein
MILKRGSYLTGRYVALTAQLPRHVVGWTFECERASLTLALRVEEEPLIELDLSFDGERFASYLDWLLPDRRRDENSKGWCRRRPAGCHGDGALVS